MVYSIFIFHQILTSLSLVSFILRGHELICIAGRVKITSELKRKIIAIELNLDLGCQHLYKGQQSLRLDAVINELAPLSLINSRRCSFKFLCEKMPMPLRSLTGRATSDSSNKSAFYFFTVKVQLKPLALFVLPYFYQIDLGNHESVLVYKHNSF